MQRTQDLFLFRPFRLGTLEVPNRVVMAPMTRSRSDDAGVPPPFAADYYAQRASAGLIVSEATDVSPQARGYALTPGIWAPAQVEAWRAVTRAVHAQGERMMLQLWHTGRISHPSLHDEALVRRLPGFQNGEATVNGVRLHYVVGGDGPPLVLLPGHPETWWGTTRSCPSWRGTSA